MNALASSTRPAEANTPKPASVNRGCLALNARMEPHEVMSVSRALRLVTEGRAEIVELDGTVIRSEKGAVEAPAVIRLTRNIPVPRNLRRQVTNVILFARDRETCGYCGRHRSELGEREFLTRDHIVPQVWFRKNGGDPNTWGNCITACRSCNVRKADLSLEEAGMELRFQPTEPHFVELTWAIRTRRLTVLQRKYISRFYGEAMMGGLTATVATAGKPHRTNALLPPAPR